MEMDVKDRLTCVAVDVEHRPIAALGVPMFRGNRSAPSQHGANQMVVGRGQVVQRRDVPSWNHEHVERSLRVDVVEGDQFVVLVCELGRNVSSRNLAKQAIGHAQILAPLGVDYRNGHDLESRRAACELFETARSSREEVSHPDRRAHARVHRAVAVRLGTSTSDGADVTPRGDAPGFVHVRDDSTLLLPDWPGNNRLDSLSNLVANPQLGLLFLVPGVDESLRVNGIAAISTDSSLLARWDVAGRHPRAVIVVTVKEAYLHCGKALIRSKLWADDYKVERTQLPSYAQMLKDQIATPDTAEQLAESIGKAYREGLY
jgi:PPOX class probable FMN-dependent enzyme